MSFLSHHRILRFIVRVIITKTLETFTFLHILKQKSLDRDIKRKTDRAKKKRELKGTRVKEKSRK